MVDRRIFKLCMCDENEKVLSEKLLEVKWSIDLKKDMKELFDLSFENEISRVLSEQIKEGITPDLILDLMGDKK